MALAIQLQALLTRLATSPAQAWVAKVGIEAVAVTGGDVKVPQKNLASAMCCGDRRARKQLSASQTCCAETEAMLLRIVKLRRSFIAFSGLPKNCNNPKPRTENEEKSPTL